MKWERTIVEGKYLNLIGFDEIGASIDFDELFSCMVDDIQPLSRGAWNHLRCEFWLDSGRVVFFLATLEDKRRESGVCQVVSSAMLAKFDALALESEDDEIFEDEIRKLEIGLVHRILESVRRSRLLDALNLDTLGIHFHDGEDPTPFCRQTVTRAR